MHTRNTKEKSLHMKRMNDENENKIENFKFYMFILINIKDYIFTLGINVSFNLFFIKIKT